MFLYSSALLPVNTLPLIVAFTLDLIYNAPFPESVLAENTDSRTDRLLPPLKTTFLTILSVNSDPEIVIWSLYPEEIIWLALLPVNMELFTSRLLLPAAKIISPSRVLL